MPVRQRGSLKDLERRFRRGLERGLQDLTLEVKTQVQKENPVDTGRSRAAWAAKFDRRRLRGVVGNRTRYIRYVAQGRRGRRTARQRRNMGFHRRGAERAMRRARELLIRALRRERVPI